MIKGNFGLSQSDFKEIINILEKFPQIEAALIFGSRALDNYKNSSDIDIVLKGNVEEIYLEVKSLLNEETLLPYFFDVLVYENVKNKNLKNHIVEFGKLIYSKNQNSNKLPK